MISHYIHIHSDGIQPNHPTNYCKSCYTRSYPHHCIYIYISEYIHMYIYIYIMNPHYIPIYPYISLYIPIRPPLHRKHPNVYPYLDVHFSHIGSVPKNHPISVWIFPKNIQLVHYSPLTMAVFGPKKPVKNRKPPENPQKTTKTPGLTGPGRLTPQLPCP